MPIDVEREAKKLHDKMLKVFGTIGKSASWYLEPNKELRGHSPRDYVTHGGDLETIHELLDKIKK